MSGDLQVRKRKGKSKVKEEPIREAPGSRNGSSSSSSGYMASALSNSNFGTVDDSANHVIPDKSLEDARDRAGSGCLAKMLFAFLVSTLLVLSGLIYVHLHSGNSTPLIIEYPKMRIDTSVKNSPVINLKFERANKEREIDIASIEEQIVSDEVIEQLSRGKQVEEVVVNILDKDVPSTEPVDEPPFVKERVTMLGEEQGKEQETERTKVSDEQQDSAQRKKNLGKEEAKVEESKVKAVNIGKEEDLQEPFNDIQNNKKNLSITDTSSNLMQNEAESSLLGQDSVSSTPNSAEEITSRKDLEEKNRSSPSLSTSNAKHGSSTTDAQSSAEQAETASSGNEAKEEAKQADVASSGKDTKKEVMQSDAATGKETNNEAKETKQTDPASSGKEKNKEAKETKQTDPASSGKETNKEAKETKQTDPASSGKDTMQMGNKKRRGRAPPSSEELLPHHNSIKRSERLMEAILELSPNHPIVAELRPHLDGAKRDLAEHKLQGLEDTTKHVLLILEDVYVRLADQLEHGPSNTDPLHAVDEFDSVAAHAERSSLTSTDDVPPADLNEPVKRSPPNTAAAPHSNDPPKTSPPVPFPVASPPSALGEEATNAKLLASSSLKTTAATTDSSHKQKESVARPVPDQGSRDTTSEASKPASSAPVEESAPRELPASSGGSVGLDDLTEEDLVSAVDTEELTEQMRASEQLRQEDPREALRVFTAAVREQPLSPRAALGRARCLDLLAEREKSNDRLDQAIASYRKIVTLSEDRPELVGLRLLRATGNKLVDKLRFRGHVSACVRVQQRLVQQFPHDVSLRNQLGISFLLQGQPKAAEQVFRTVLDTWPDSGLAQVHLGFILKTTHGNNSEGARLMKAGLSSKDEGTRDARFYFHLGDALHRLGRKKEARQVNEEGAAQGIFLSASQRSLYNVDRLTARPVWTPEQTTYQDFLNILQQNWRAIRAEGVALLDAPSSEGFVPEAENLRDSGQWKQLELFARGKKHSVNCVRAPMTCAIVANYPPAASCKRGQVKFSVLEGGTHVWAHCGPTNCRLRAHLGLVVPQENPGPVLIVDNTVLRWGEGEILVFDDSFEHEVWHNGTQRRLVLIVDLWHPELSDKERATLAPV